MSNIIQNGLFGQLHVHNPEIAQLIKGNYTLEDIAHLHKVLADKMTTKIRRYKSGGHSAVTVLDLDHTLEAAVDGLLIFQWDRDNIMQCLAELAIAEKPSANAALQIPADQWKRGLRSSIIHHRKGEERFLDIIHGRKSGYPKDYFSRPHIRYNPFSLHEVGDPWGHGQNDSLAFVNFLLFHALKTNRMAFSEDGDYAAFAALLHAYFWRIHVWEDFDLGAWEDRVGEHWSSIACALVSLREQQAFLDSYGALRYNRLGHDYWSTAHGAGEMADKCETRLRELGTMEFIRSDNGETRDVDLAQLNPLLLAAFSGRPVLSDANTLAILDNIENRLMGHIGIRRYNKDIWDGRINRGDLGPGQEAQWCHGSPQMSYIYGEMYLRTGDERYYDKQLAHFNRALAAISPRGLYPECYIIDMNTREWVADANEPLAWAQSMLILSLVQMQNSIERKQAGNN